SPIKSIFSSVGCPFTCTYCYAPTFNDMHGGFKLTMRSVDDVIAEARAVCERWPTRMFYFQDDIWGYDRKWLDDFASRWPQEVDVPFHVQIRLELTRHKVGDQRLDLFAEAGCSGISLAIESGNDFLRDHVLFRHMPGDLIEEGCKKIMDRGMTLRTEQILAVPFSDRSTDLSTLGLNNRINPTMMWTSILAPYKGTDMGTIAHNFGLYEGENDDLAESFFDRSVLNHVARGPRDMEAVVAKLGSGPRDRTLLAMKAVKNGDPGSAEIVHREHGTVGKMEYLDQAANAQYCQDTVRLQRLANFLAKVPSAEALGTALVSVPEVDWSWERIGKETTSHLEKHVGMPRLEQWQHALAEEMQLPLDALPGPVAQNPFYFCFFSEGGKLARKALNEDAFVSGDVGKSLDALGTIARRHLFTHELYKIEVGKSPIAVQ
ncbi:MAG: radical SAM protein, partial [Patescibacteria group bacterium]